MDPGFRRAFNAAFTAELYERYQARLAAEVGEIPYRLAESPVFATPHLRDQLFRATTEILGQLAEAPKLGAMKRAVPAGMPVPGPGDMPTCMTVDFAVTRTADGRLEGKVVELQAFPSLYAFTLAQFRLWDELLRTLPGLDRAWSCFVPGMDYEGAVSLLQRSLLDGHAPENVVLLEIEPHKQKTRTDFVATEKLAGIEAVCVTDVVREGRKLLRRKGGKLVPIHRVYNRVVFDELDRKKPAMAFRFDEDLDLTWAPHPSWYWIWSKYSLHLLDHPAVPKATLLSELREVPADLSRYVLKPLFSYAGAGVKVDPTREDVDAVPEGQRGGWILQEKIDYARDMVTPEGHGVATEVRMLCLRAPGEAMPKPFMNLVRLSRGKMLGIDFNKDFTWVGSSVLIWPA